MGDRNKVLKPYLSPVMVAAFSIGSAIGWGSLVVTNSNYLGKAGIAGSVIGLILSMVIMLVVARNYSYLIQIYPDSGGSYAFSREVFGHDYGFLTAWFLILTYLSILWANATSLPLFARYFIGPVFEFGKLYTIVGHDVYVGEMLLTAAGVLVVAFLCYISRKAAAYAMMILVGIIILTVTIVSVSAITGHSGVVDNSFIVDNKAVSQVIYIAMISPWAFIGFENISHSAEEFKFKRTGIYNILVASVIITTLLYILIVMLSVTAYPERYSSWMEYIKHCGELDGIEALPAFYAANHYLGANGVKILMAALLSLVFTSLIGNITATSRLLYAMGREGMISEKYGEVGRFRTPGRAILLIVISALIIPIIGRTAVGWVVDVTCIGAILIYGIVSACALKKARERNDAAEVFTGLLGLALMILAGLYTLIPNLISTGAIARETYILFIVWSILGFVFFRLLLGHDKSRKYGKSVIVWASLLTLILLISLIWMRQSIIEANAKLQSNIETYYEQHDTETADEDLEYIREQISDLERSGTRSILMALGMFGIAMVIMFSNHSYLSGRQRENDKILNTDPLTGVKSKHAFLTMVREADNKIINGNTEAFAVVVCDINGLKHVNDTHGHKAGDEYICAASDMICDIFRRSPVYRLGGDEFVAVLKGHDYEVRDKLMQLLHDRSERNIPLGSVVVAGGISEFRPGEDNHFHVVFDRADKLMYAEKRSLKNDGAITR